MAIPATGSKLHWNYFLALERDLELVARYVEFTPANYKVFSIELAHLLFAAASEVDVIAKLIGAQVAPAQPCTNIAEYEPILMQYLPELARTNVYIPRHGLTLTPWENWGEGKHLIWWQAYNKVKHQRADHFNQATLKNALNALGALLIVTFHYYSRHLSETGAALSAKDTTQLLQPQSTFLRLDESCYRGHLLLE